MIDDIFASKMNKFVFLVPLPVLLFEDLSTVDFSQVWNMKFVLFCFSVTLISIALAAAVSFLWRDRSIRGEFIQAAYRSSAALLGIAFIQNIYGDAGMAPLMIIGSVPLYNVMAVVVLSFFRPLQIRLYWESQRDSSGPPFGFPCHPFWKRPCRISEQRQPLSG